MRRLVSDGVFVNGIIQNADGDITWNAFQTDDPVRRRVYDDGTIVVQRLRTGRLIAPPYRVNDEDGSMIIVTDWSDEG